MSMAKDEGARRTAAAKNEARKRAGEENMGGIHPNYRTDLEDGEFQKAAERNAKNLQFRSGGQIP